MKYIVGVYDGEGPPVPIPNTAVKLTGAENTCMATCREHKSTPTLKLREAIASLFFYLFAFAKFADFL